MYVPGCRLRVEVMVQSTGQWLWAEYDNMTVESENNYYRLHVTGYHGDAGDAFNDRQPTWQANGMQFSTPDVDNDRWPSGNCASGAKGGWWFNWCSSSKLNARRQCWYSTPPPATTTPIRVDASRMMLQCGAV